MKSLTAPNLTSHSETGKTSLERDLETAEEFGDPIPQPKGRRSMLA